MRREVAGYISKQTLALQHKQKQFDEDPTELEALWKKDVPDAEQSCSIEQSAEPLSTAVVMIFSRVRG